MKNLRFAFIAIVFFHLSFTAWTLESQAESRSESEQVPRVVFWTCDPQWSITAALSIEDGTDYNLDMVGFDLTTDVDMAQFDVSWGCKFFGQSADLTARLIYWPTFWGCFNAGVGTTFHSQFYTQEYCELDLLTGIYLKYDAHKIFSAQVDFSHHFKAARIYEIQDSLPWLKNDSIALHAGIAVNLKDRVHITFDFASYSYYRYFLFFAPDFKLGSSLKIDDHWFFGTEAELQYIDLFTLSANFNSFAARAWFKYSI